MKRIISIVLLLTVYPMVLISEESGAEEAVKRGGIPVIYETDMTLDVDDVGALAVLHGLQKEGEVDLLGVCYNEVHPLGPDAIDVINTYYNCGTIPIGIYKKELANPDPSDYFTRELGFDVDNMPHNPFDNIVADAVAVYKPRVRSNLS